jgi:hypothetical protein
VGLGQSSNQRLNQSRAAGALSCFSMSAMGVSLSCFLLRRRVRRCPVGVDVLGGVSLGRR